MESYKVLLVDDEKLTTMSMEKLIRTTECRFEVAGTAGNGETALQILEETQADIVFVDIRMPRMDGIEFLRQVRKRGLETKVIILSAYRDFEYAQQALNLGARGYLLKPVSREKMFEALEEAADLLDQERRIKRQNMLEEQKVAVYALLGRGERTEYLPEKFLCREAKGLCLMSCTENLPRTFREDCVERGWYPLRDNHMVMPFLWEKEEELLKERIREIRDCVEEYLLTDVTFTVSGEVKETQGFQNAYNECKIATMYYFYLSAQETISYEEIKNFGKISILETVKQFEQMKEMLILGSEEEIMAGLKKLYQDLKEEMSTNAETVYQMSADLLNQLYTRKISDKDRNGLPQPDEIRNKVHRFATLDTLFRYMEEEFSHCLANQSEKHQEPDDKLITEIKVFCRENFNKVCSLDDIAGHMYISKSYLSQVFKEKTGDSIWNYFTDIRIEEAKKMLASGHVKATDVSRLVGYKNPSHFGRIFKERVGASPKEYQQMVRQ